LLDGTGKSKVGYRKIMCCGKQALEDGFEYFWVDTCCIDKSSSAELSEAINSMWRWYSHSHICYAYLNDVYAGIDGLRLDSAVAASEWFKRGWTLQELLAPLSLKLYNESWEHIGTRASLAFTISRATGIGTQFLHGGHEALWQASIAMRMSWASSRLTTRLEDQAYCLLGIFDINMPLLYGEGRRAFQRLQEEIIKRSDDQSIFAFPRIQSNDTGGIFASSPGEFRYCRNIVQNFDYAPVKPYAVTNRGLQIEFPLQKDGGELYARLNCRFSSELLSSLAIPLVHIDQDQYERDRGMVRAFGNDDWYSTVVRPMYIRLLPSDHNGTSALNDQSCIVQTLPRGFYISEGYPKRSWAPMTRVFTPMPDNSSQLDTSKHGIIVVRSLGSHYFRFMVFPRTKRHFRQGDFDARLLPEDYGNSDVADIYSQWTSKDLSKLPRTRISEMGVIILRATPMVVSRKIITRIDIAIKDKSFSHSREALERGRAVCHLTGHVVTIIL
ncbi:hypothetical protein IQ07DRAFT_485617, partial [Pyrenochaeta sp. DS3sAY3a]